MKRPRRSRHSGHSDQSGQSTIEFALTLLLLMGFVLFFIQLTFVLSFGNYAHYATFMAARAYLSAGETDGDSLRRAQDVLAHMVKKGGPGRDRFPNIAVGEGGGGEFRGAQFGPLDDFNPADQDKGWMQGVRYTFRSRLFVLPFAGRAPAGAANRLKLISESLLGGEPSYTSCKEFLSKKGALFDNGC